jgi:hypothetical protein
MGIVTSRAILAVALLAAGPSIAWGQAFNAIGSKTPPPTPKVAPPPALPGAADDASRAVPSMRPTNDLEPTDALFDAINRGDIAAARDAISRGADLHGQNILGMTPMELSVDLGRNDISFLLLSMRGADDGRSGPPPATTAATKQGGARAAKAARPQTAAKTAPAKPPAAQQTARLFSGDGGTPIPNAGFLGFDSGRH